MFEFIVNGSLLSAFGATMNYVFNEVWVEKNKFNIFSVFIVCILGLFVGNITHSLLPLDWEYRDSALLIAGFSFSPILKAIEKIAPEVLVKHLGKTLNVNIDKTKVKAKDERNETTKQS